MTNQTDPGIAEINKKLDRIVWLLSLNAVSHATSTKDKAVQLSRVGLAPKEIAHLLGSTPNSVSVALSEARRSKKKKAK